MSYISKENEIRAKSLFEILPNKSGKDDWEDYPDHFKSVIRHYAQFKTYYHQPNKRYYGWDENNQAYEMDI